ncbi:hypothetical protein [Streptomyces rapamycinicus]|uniref:hypothetical protein n=1 Tax=Streptomyces rapamycinicus TaxID=1226757 RepID=UPI0003830858|nr:hypothetical protein [Streptomyces rapamycinicus]AGP57913.1 hypothetical protein M271_32460 [Streptomyces rapamycinicus NRRL 5491]UTO65750.1 hypothetical protein LJB45_27820 [Streptomyces rapamycinicus]UTP33707.1 hypothetical protein LIV37_32950 [Streptomyces rapamycinicus NRRL 5491]
MTACEPTGGGISSVTVAITTDQVATEALERGGVGVRWMSCNAEFRNGRTAGAASPSRSDSQSERSGETDARVDCHGRTDNDKDVRIRGRVTYVREDHCVRGDLTGQVDGRKVFEANVIGECQGGGSDTGSPRPTRSPTREHRTTEAPEPTRSPPWEHRTTEAPEPTRSHPWEHRTTEAPEPTRGHPWEHPSTEGGAGQVGADDGAGEDGKGGTGGGGRSE